MRWKEIMKNDPNNWPTHVAGKIDAVHKHYNRGGKERLEMQSSIIHRQGKPYAVLFVVPASDPCKGCGGSPTYDLLIQPAGAAEGENIAVLGEGFCSEDTAMAVGEVVYQAIVWEAEHGRTTSE